MTEKDVQLTLGQPVYLQATQRKIYMATVS